MEAYDIIKQLAGELHDLQAKFEQSERDREQYLTWWLEEQGKRKNAEEKLAAVVSDQEWTEERIAQEE